VIETIGGRPPMSLEAFIEKHRKALSEHSPQRRRRNVRAIPSVVTVSIVTGRFA
jgi:hypothetical protein